MSDTPTVPMRQFEPVTREQLEQAGGPPVPTVDLVGRVAGEFLAAPKPGHDLVFCKLDGCPNELDGTEPKRGLWVGMCVACRRGETAQGLLYRETKGIGKRPVDTSAHAQTGMTGAAVARASESLRGGAGLTKPSLESLAKRLPPLAAKVEKNVSRSKDAKTDAADAVKAFSAALQELRDVAQQLITS